MSKLSVIRIKLKEQTNRPSQIIEQMMEKGWRVESNEISFAIHDNSQNEWVTNKEIQTVLSILDEASKQGIPISIELRRRFNPDVYICLTQINKFEWSIRIDGMPKLIKNLKIYDPSWYIQRVIPIFFLSSNTQSIIEISWSES